MRAQRDDATDERKLLWRKEQEVTAGRKAAIDELDKAHRTLQHSMSKQQWDAINVVRKMAAEKRMKGFHGMVRRCLALARTKNV